MIKKHVALGFVICNSIYLIACIVRFFYTGSQIIIDFSKTPPLVLPQNSLWYIVPQLLYVILFMGLLWLLRIFNEKIWIQLGVIMFILSKIATFLILHFKDNRFLIDNTFWYDVVNIGNFVTLLYLLIALFLIKTKTLRLYFRWLAILMIISILIPRLGQILYDDFSVHGLLINSDTMTQLCFVPTLILFIKIFIFSTKDSELTSL